MAFELSRHTRTSDLSEEAVTSEPKLDRKTCPYAKTGGDRHQPEQMRGYAPTRHSFVQ